MFGALKRLFSKPVQPLRPPLNPLPTSKCHTPKPSLPVVAPPPRPPEPPAVEVSLPLKAPATPAPVKPREPANKLFDTANEIDSLRLPLQSILTRLPSTLTSLAKCEPSDCIKIPLQEILHQLPSGAVRMPFGKLRQSAAPGIFAENASFDQVIIDLPLGDILPRIDPGVLTRRAQTQIEVPESVASIFGDSSSNGLQNRQTQVKIDTQPALAATPRSSLPPEKPISVQAQTPHQSKPQPVNKPAACVLPGPKPSGLQLRNQQPKPAAIPAPTLPVAPAPVTPVVAPSAPATAPDITLTVAVSAVSESWPEGVKQEIKNLNLGTSSLRLPLNRVEPAIRTGRIVFAWGELISWLQPAASGLSSPLRELKLEIPLKVIFPLFLAQQPSRKQKKAAFAENIPDLFSGVPLKAPSPAPVPVAAPAPAEPVQVAPPPPAIEAPLPPKPVPVSTPNAAALMGATTTAPSGSTEFRMLGTTLGELLGQSSKNDWSPREIVLKTLSFNGVAGSMITMGDGLLVANRLPETLKAETIAAFLPQIFGRMNQYAKELQLGGLSSVTMVVGNAPCAIYKAGSLYFMVLGRAGEPLPEARLQRIASALAKNNQ